MVRRLQLRNLADTYVEDPVKEFPEGKHITARVLMARDGLIELTCKTAKPESAKQDLKDFSLGQVCERACVCICSTYVPEIETTLVCVSVAYMFLKLKRHRASCCCLRG